MLSTVPPAGEVAALLAVVPEPLRWIAVLGIMLGVGYALSRPYVKAKTAPEPPAKGQDLVLAAASLLDTAPIKELTKSTSDVANELRGARHTLEQIYTLLTEMKQDRDNDREVARQVELGLITRLREERDKPVRGR